jgi:hypothetical protein
LKSEVAGVGNALKRAESVFEENPEINYLLRKVEDYRELAILAANIKFLFGHPFLNGSR